MNTLRECVDVGAVDYQFLAACCGSRNNTFASIPELYRPQISATCETLYFNLQDAPHSNTFQAAHKCPWESTSALAFQPPSVYLNAGMESCSDGIYPTASLSGGDELPHRMVGFGLRDSRFRCQALPHCKVSVKHTMKLNSCVFSLADG